MPISDPTQGRRYTCTLKTIAAMLGITLSTGAGLLWLNQQAIERYWQQTRHAPSPFSDFSPSWWQAGATLEDALQSHIQQLELWLTPAQDIAADTPLVDDNEVDGDDTASDADTSDVALHEAPTQHSSSSMDAINGQPVHDGLPLKVAPPHAHPATSAANIQPASPPAVTEPARPVTQEPISEHQPVITLAPQDRVLFIGDSMMQGVAPHVMKTLLKQYHIQSTNLSLQSTGLTYPKAFDWPDNLRTALTNMPDIKVLVVFLGPNDPWDMPSHARSPYLKFKSPAWETEYRSRIRNILEQAKAQGIAVIWIGPPAMKRVALSEGVRFLDSLYQSEVETAGQYYIAVDDLFGYQDHRYSDPTTLNGRPVRLRSDDGTHFTPTGQKLIAHAVLNLLQPTIQETAAPAVSESSTPLTAPEVAPKPQNAHSNAAEQVFADPTQKHPSMDKKAAAAKVFVPSP